MPGNERVTDGRAGLFFLCSPGLSTKSIRLHFDVVSMSYSSLQHAQSMLLFIVNKLCSARAVKSPETSTDEGQF